MTWYAASLSSNYKMNYIVHFVIELRVSLEEPWPSRALHAHDRRLGGLASSSRSCPRGALHGPRGARRTDAALDAGVCQLRDRCPGPRAGSGTPAHA